MKEMIYSIEPIKEVLYKGEKDGYIFVIMSYGTHPCAYVGIPKNHGYYGLKYDDINISCHWGLTFAEPYCKFMPWIENAREKELWWIGWDYGHCDDYMPYLEFFNFFGADELKKWTTKEIIDECYDVIEQLKEIE